MRNDAIDDQAGGIGDALGVKWSLWVPLSTAGANPFVPAEPGLYRIRVAATEPILYIGQTGRSLRERLGALRGVYGEQMPYNDPHTAGPGLWALRHRDGVDFEASVVAMPGDRVHLLGREALAVSTVRAISGASPALNFGGMPLGYRKSTGNTTRLVAAGTRRRGGPDVASLGSTASGPMGGPLLCPPAVANWLGLAWSPWEAAGTLPSERGAYRIRRPGADDLLYVGQGHIGSRVRAHLAKGQRADHRQGPYFAGPTEVSWVMLGEMTTRQLLEIENDLIASHVLTAGCAPLAQFLG